VGAQKYQELAFECLRLAEATRDPAAQDEFIQMAATWARLADEAERAPRAPDAGPAAA